MGIASSTATVTVFAFTTFETKEHAREIKEDTRQLFEHIREDLKNLDHKLDRYFRAR